MKKVQEVIENVKRTHLKEIIHEYSQTQDKTCPYVLGNSLHLRAHLWNVCFL